MPAMPQVSTHRFAAAGGFPNNPHLPVVIYKGAPTAISAPEPEALAHWFETIWPHHDWHPAWRWGVYDFPHYHSTAHEILGVFKGRARLRLGAAGGLTYVAEAGDVLVLPAGTAHQNLGASADFQVVGGYPAGQSADLLRGAPGERPAADQRIAAVSLPKADPLYGAAGPLVAAWHL